MAKLNSRNLYKGFSFFEYEKTGSFLITDVELVKLDLLNHIFTRRGDRIRQVQFGTSIPDIVFENITDDLIEDVYDELESVFNFDPRVKLISLEVTPSADENSITASVTIRYVELDFTETLNLNIIVEE